MPDGPPLPEWRRGCGRLFLDPDNRLLRDESADWDGEADRTPPPCSLCGLARCAVEAGAAAVILVRPRPDDDGTEPTAAEVEGARRAHTALAALELVLHDYVFVAGGRCTSLRDAGLLRRALWTHVAEVGNSGSRLGEQWS